MTSRDRTAATDMRKGVAVEKIRCLGVCETALEERKKGKTAAQAEAATQETEEKEAGMADACREASL